MTKEQQKTDILVSSPELISALEKIRGEDILEGINRLSEYADGGVVGAGGSRLTLSSGERKTRPYLRLEMEKAGMDVHEYPGFIMGIYHGADPDSPDYLNQKAVGCGSHHDTVPQPGKFDGQFGVIAAIHAVKALHEAKIRPKRPVIVFSFTGEEQPSMIGSRSAFLGLNDDDLKVKLHNGEMTADLLLENNFRPEGLYYPIVTKDDMHAFVEIHSQAGNSLTRDGKTLGIVEGIVGKDIREIIVGSPLSDKDSYTYEGPAVDLFIGSKGIAEHVGSTPMGINERADALVNISDLVNSINTFSDIVYREISEGLYEGSNIHKMLLQAFGNLPLDELRLAFAKDLVDRTINIIGLEIENESGNVIPGHVRLHLRLTPKIPDLLPLYIEGIKTIIAILNKIPLGIPHDMTKYPRNPLDIVDCQIHPNIKIRQFDSFEINKRWAVTAGSIIRFFRKATQYSTEYSPNITATVGTCKLNNDGTIRFGLDIRGDHIMTSGLMRDYCELFGIDSSTSAGKGQYIYRYNENPSWEERIDVSISPPLPGSGPPVYFDKGLKQKLLQVASSLGIPSINIAIIPPGEDAMNAQRAGIPTAFIFVRSGNNGICHSPEEMMYPKDMEDSTKFLLATLYQLAMDY